MKELREKLEASKIDFAYNWKEIDIFQLLVSDYYKENHPTLTIKKNGKRWIIIKKINNEITNTIKIKKINDLINYIKEYQEKISDLDNEKRKLENRAKEF